LGNGVESYIQVPIDGAGRRIRTAEVSKGGFTVQEELISLEAHQKTDLPVYILASLDRAAAASYWHALLCINPDCTKWAEVILIKVIAQATAVVAGFPMSFRIYRFATIGTATELTFSKLNTDNPDLPPTGLTPGFWGGHGAAPDAIGGLINVPLASGSINPEEGGAALETILFDEKVTGQPLLVRDGGGIGVQQYATAGVGLVDVIIVFRTRDKD